MGIRKINNVSCGLLVCLLILVSCANGDEPENPKEGLVDIEFRSPMDGFEANTRYDNPYRDFARAMTALNLDEEIVNEIHNAVSRSIECGLDEVYFFNEALDNNSKVFTEPVDFGRLLKRKLEAFPENEAVKYINEFWENYADKDRFQIYWPYSENWDGKTMPLIAARSVVFSVKEGGKIDMKDILTDEYAKKNPVIVINDSPIKYSQLPDFAKSNFVCIDKNPYIYYPTYATDAEVPHKPTYLTNNDIESYFEKKSSTVYSLYLTKIAVPSMYMSKDVSEGGVYLTYYSVNIDGQRFNNEAELNACEENHWFNRICVRRQFCKPDRMGDFVSLNMLLTGDSHRYIGSLPGGMYKETGEDISWKTIEKKGFFVAWDSEGTIMWKKYNIPYIKDGKGSVAEITRPGLYQSHYETANLFGDDGIWSTSAGYTVYSCVEGATVPDWLK